MAKKRVDIGLRKADVKFLQWLAERDGVTLHDEIKQLFYLQLQEEQDILLDEFEMETGLDFSKLCEED